MVGGTGAAAAVTVNVARFELSPPGFCTVTNTGPAAVSRPAGTSAVSWVALSITVASDCAPAPEFHCTTEPLK